MDIKNFLAFSLSIKLYSKSLLISIYLERIFESHKLQLKNETILLSKIHSYVKGVACRLAGYFFRCVVFLLVFLYS